MKRKEKNREEFHEGRRKKGLPGIILAAFTAALISYVALLNVEKNALSAYEKAECWILSETLEKGTEITTDNAARLFQRAQVDVQHIPQGAVTDPEMLAGSQAAITITQGSIVTDTMFTRLGSYRAALEKPVIAGCKADDLYQLVSGTLRSGDRIHIYTVDEEMGDAYLIWDNVMVYQTFDSGGNLIPPQDTVSAAARINVLLEEGNAELFYSELYKGSLRVVKLWE
ncbi:MAG: SAF domain-containing protein [Acetatifactor sp.]|nr:SAF domain-containing protein [Acetatifactor sp.]